MTLAKKNKGRKTDEKWILQDGFKTRIYNYNFNSIVKLVYCFIIFW